MKTKLESITVLLTAIVFLTLACLAAKAAEEPKAEELFAAKTWTVNPFASARIDHTQVDLGGGLKADYAFSKHVAIEAEAFSDGIDDSNWSEAIRAVGASVKGYLPIKTSGFAPYAIGGYQRDLIDNENQIAVGGGLEFRSGVWATFIDVRATHRLTDEASEFGDEWLVRFGVGRKF